MQYTNIIWREGQPYSEQFDDIYYSSEQGEEISGESEFQHVFFKNNGLPERWQGRNDFVIAELGFGSGLNCILTIREWLKHCAGSAEEKTLHYVAIEKYPLSAETIIELISRYPELEQLCNELIENYPPAIEATHCRRLFNNRVVIHFKFMDVHKVLEDAILNVDAWYLDGFSPAKNPDMWSQELFENIAKHSRSGATCSTYTSAGFVKRNLHNAGFVVNKVSGHGKKREMLVAELASNDQNKNEILSLNYRDEPWFEPALKKCVCNKNATIIGGGIAGLSIAYALVKRGWFVTIIERHADLGKEATSNPAPIVYPRLSVDNDTDTAFYTAAYCYALYLFKSLRKSSQKQFWYGDGLKQLISRKRITQIIEKFKFNSEFISILDEPTSPSVSEEDTENVMLDYPSAGVLLPAVLCDVLRQQCGDRVKVIEAEVTEIVRVEEKWRCMAGSRLIDEAEVTIIANGAGINELGLPITFPVESIRGQVVELNENVSSLAIKKTLNADVHITPAINGKHYLGASYSRNNKSPEISGQDNMVLLSRLNKIYPDVFNDSDYSDAWVGFRTISKDRVPIVGAVPDALFFNNEYADIQHGNTAKKYRAARYLEGLYISAAHGSRGFTSSFIAAEIIASQMTGEPMPVSKKVLDYLSPSRFIVNDLKRR